MLLLCEPKKNKKFKLGVRWGVETRESTEECLLFAKTFKVAVAKVNKGISHALFNILLYLKKVNVCKNSSSLSLQMDKNKNSSSCFIQSTSVFLFIDHLYRLCLKANSHFILEIPILT